MVVCRWNSGHNRCDTMETVWQRLWLSGHTLFVPTPIMWPQSKYTAFISDFRNDGNATTTNNNMICDPTWDVPIPALSCASMRIFKNRVAPPRILFVFRTTRFVPNAKHCLLCEKLFYWNINPGGFGHSIFIKIYVNVNLIRQRRTSVSAQKM